jgi:phage terminase large subunit-like protein
MEPADHPVSRYAADVIEGKVIAGDLVRMACERHLLDLETGRERGLVFDTQAASMICNFATMLQHTAGPMAGKPLKLEPWQVFRHGSVFVKHEATAGGSIPTTSRKEERQDNRILPCRCCSRSCSMVRRHCAYCAAMTRDQAGLLFKGGPDDPPVVDAGPVLPRGNYIDTPKTDGVIKCLSRDGDSSDGINPHFLARDEMHRWTDRELAETIVESMIARSQPIDWVITTAGHDRQSLCGELRGYAESVLRNSVQDDAFFGFVADRLQTDPMREPGRWATQILGSQNRNRGCWRRRKRLRRSRGRCRTSAGFT